MESSIWVAVITGLPSWSPLRIICFCKMGTQAAGISIPQVAVGDHDSVGFRLTDRFGFTAHQML